MSQNWQYFSDSQKVLLALLRLNLPKLALRTPTYIYTYNYTYLCKLWLHLDDFLHIWKYVYCLYSVKIQK